MKKNNNNKIYTINKKYEFSVFVNNKHSVTMS